jgi:hypothetical protein
VIEYVRAGKIAEAAYLLKHDFVHSLSDLNRLYEAALTGDLP